MSADKFLTKNEQVELLRSSVKEWNYYRELKLKFPDSFDRVDLSGLDLSGVNLSGMNFFGANLKGVDLEAAILSEAEFSAADFSGASLYHADLSLSTFRSSCFKSSEMVRAILEGAVVDDADFGGATFGSTMFFDVDLSRAVDLDGVIHAGASFLGVDTLVASGFDIPEGFLEGCGVPRQLIDYLPAFKALPIQYYSCFISYSQKDEAFTKRLYEGLKSENIRVWYAPEEMKGGRTILDQIDTAIRKHDKLLLVLSEASMNSQWVKTEIRKARKKEQQTGRRVLFPISIVDYEAVQCWECFDAGSGADMADDIREYYIPDFSNWKNHDAFQVEFKKLVVALQESEEE